MIGKFELQSLETAFINYHHVSMLPLVPSKLFLTSFMAFSKTKALQVLDYVSYLAFLAIISF